MLNDNEGIIFIARRPGDAAVLGVFSNIGTAIKGAEHILKADRVKDVRLNLRPEHEPIATVEHDNGTIEIFGIEIDENHSIDGVVTL